MPDEPMSWNWHGVADLQAAFGELSTKAEAATQDALREAGESVRKAAKAQFGTATGPTSRTGRAMGSIVVSPLKKDAFGTAGLEIGPTGLPYLRKLELGKKGRGHRKPHPYLAPGFKEAARTFEAVFRSHWAKSTT